MTRALEVIVTSATEARDAEQGGADRLELTHSLEDEGLTPASRVVYEVANAVSVPVRAILRDVPSMEMEGQADATTLAAKAKVFSESNMEGFVLGFARRGDPDERALEAVLKAVPHAKVTFHRAFEQLRDPLRAIQRLKQYRQIDRILTNGGAGCWNERKARLIEWQNAAAPEIEIVVGGGLTLPLLIELAAEPGLRQFHVGRAARTPASASGTVTAEQVALLKRAIA